jgi:hypothetical protein
MIGPITAPQLREGLQKLDGNEQAGGKAPRNASN